MPAQHSDPQREHRAMWRPRAAQRRGTETHALPVKLAAQPDPPRGRIRCIATWEGRFMTASAARSSSRCCRTRAATTPLARRADPGPARRAGGGCLSRASWSWRCDAREGCYSAGHVKIGVGGDFVTAPEGVRLFNLRARSAPRLLTTTGPGLLELGAHRAHGGRGSDRASARGAPEG